MANDRLRNLDYGFLLPCKLMLLDLGFFFIYIYKMDMFLKLIVLLILHENFLAQHGHFT